MNCIFAMFNGFVNGLFPDPARGFVTNFIAPAKRAIKRQIGNDTVCANGARFPLNSSVKPFARGNIKNTKNGLGQ